MNEGEARTPWIAAPPPPPPPPAGSAGEQKAQAEHELRSPRGASHSPLSEAASVLRSAGRTLSTRSPWMLAATAILGVFATGWFAGALLAFRHARGITGQSRFLEFFSSGSAPWAVAVVVAVVLVAAGRRFDPRTEHADSFGRLLTTGLFLAGCWVSLSAAIDALVEVANFGHGIDGALAALVAYAGAFPVGVAAAWWAHGLHTRRTGF